MSNGYLLDTHIILFALQTPEKLSDAAREAVLSERCILSVVSYWEVMIKNMKGRLDVGDPRIWWRDALEQLTASELALHSRHVSSLSKLPEIHKDPYDRIMIAQAITEGMIFVTADKKAADYAAAGLHVIV